MIFSYSSEQDAFNCFFIDDITIYRQKNRLDKDKKCWCERNICSNNQDRSARDDVKIETIRVEQTKNISAE